MHSNNMNTLNPCTHGLADRSAEINAFGIFKRMLELACKLSARKKYPNTKKDTASAAAEPYKYKDSGTGKV